MLNQSLPYTEMFIYLQAFNFLNHPGSSRTFLGAGGISPHVFLLTAGLLLLHSWGFRGVLSYLRVFFIPSVLGEMLIFSNRA